MAPEPGDLLTLVPPTRRAIDGPAADAPDAPSATLTDDQVVALIADAIGSIIFFTGGVFGHQLEVTARDDTYGAPNAWEITPPPAEHEKTVIVAQAAIDHFFHTLRDLKVSEEIADEGQRWSYQLSAQLIREHLLYLQRQRDSALEIVEAQHPVPTAFVSFLHERDGYTAALVEPYVHGALGGGQELWR